MSLKICMGRGISQKLVIGGGGGGNYSALESTRIYEFISDVFNCTLVWRIIKSGNNKVSEMKMFLNFVLLRCYTGTY